MNVWDSVEFSRQVRDFLASQRQAQRLEQRATEIKIALNDINTTLPSRLRPP